MNFKDFGALLGSSRAGKVSSVLICFRKSQDLGVLGF